MKKANCILLLIFCALLLNRVSAQTAKEIQGTWRVLSTTIKNANGEEIIVMDSLTHNLTKVITANRVMFTIYNMKTDSLMISGQGKAMTKGNQYIETFEQSTGKQLLRQPMVFTYKIQGNKLSYEGGSKDLHIVEVLRRIE
jgi:uncharacterized protein YdaL